MGDKFIYNRSARTSKQAIAQKVLETMLYDRAEETFEIIDAPKSSQKEQIQIPWTAETLMNILQRWNSMLALQMLNEILDGLMTSGYITQGALQNYELTSTGRVEAEEFL